MRDKGTRDYEISSDNGRVGVAADINTLSSNNLSIAKLPQEGIVNVRRTDSV